MLAVARRGCSLCTIGLYDQQVEVSFAVRCLAACGHPRLQTTGAISAVLSLFPSLAFHPESFKSFLISYLFHPFLFLNQGSMNPSLDYKVLRVPLLDGIQTPEDREPGCLDAALGRMVTGQKSIMAYLCCERKSALIFIR